MRYLLLPMILFCFAVPAVAAQGLSRENCASAITMYCTMCHTTERICKGLNSFDAPGWTRVLQRMGEQSADIDQGVQEMVHACLHMMKPGDSMVCGNDAESP